MQTKHAPARELNTFAHIMDSLLSGNPITKKDLQDSGSVLHAVQDCMDKQEDAIFLPGEPMVNA